MITALVALCSISNVTGTALRDASTPARALPRLAEPFRVLALGEPITAVTGHAAPFVLDLDGDGKRDLVVGMFGSDATNVNGGTARFYRNVGTNRQPEFTAFTTLKAEGKPMTMESS